MNISTFYLLSWDHKAQWDGDRYGRSLENELKGLKIRYTRPDKQVREWRFQKVMEAANKVKLYIYIYYYIVICHINIVIAAKI